MRSKFSRALDTSQRFYSDHVTYSGMMNNWAVSRFLNKLDEFIIEESSSIVDPYSRLSDFYGNDKLYAYVDAKEKLLKYQQLRQESIEAWSDTSAKT